MIDKPFDSGYSKKAHQKMRPGYVITFPRSRGVSGALYLQAARAGVMFCPGCFTVKLPLVRGVDVLVLRNGNL